MPASEAVSSFGTLLAIGDGGGSEVFTNIAEVKDISGPSLGIGTEEVTTHLSPGGVREFIGTLTDPGEVSFDINFIGDDTQGPADGLYADAIARVKRNFKLTFPT